MSQAPLDNIVSLMRHRISSTPRAEAYRAFEQGKWVSMRWQQVGERVRAQAGGLMARGIQHGEHCAVIASTQPLWMIADLAVLSIGAVSVSIYPMTPEDELVELIRHSEVRLCYVENPEMARRLRDRCPHIPEDCWIPLREDPREGLQRFESAGEEWHQSHPGDWETRGASVQSHDRATMIYTAGSTGFPKGVLTSHDAWIYAGEAIELLDLLHPYDRQYLHLPLAHSFARTMAYAAMRMGVLTVLESRLDRLEEGLRALQPTIFPTVPRVLDDIRKRVESEMLQAGPRGRAALRLLNSERSGWQRTRQMLGAPLREATGGALRFILSGGAPMDARTERFLRRCGLVVLEGYGLTESAAASTVTLPGEEHRGSVGKPLPGTEVRISAEGEILLKSRGLMMGYHRPGPNQTDEVHVDDEGWLHTGDLGHMDEEDSLWITGRRKDILITSTGKNIAPRKIEARIRTRLSEVDHVLLVGDGEASCAAILLMKAETLQRVSQRRDQLQDIWRGIQETNQTLSHHEQIRRVGLVETQRAHDAQAVTPKLGLRRSKLQQVLSESIRSLYAARFSLWEAPVMRL